MVSNAVRNEMTEWERVHEQMLRDIRRLREEKVEILSEVEQLRGERDEQRREWEIEREKTREEKTGPHALLGPSSTVDCAVPERPFSALRGTDV